MPLISERSRRFYLRDIQKFKDIFRKINNKIEMDVVATWSDLNSIIKEIGEEQDVKRLRKKVCLSLKAYLLKTR